MGLIKFGTGVAGISGKIGGTVYARNKQGAYARNWAKPVNPVTASQAAVRANFQAASSQWNALTNTERDAWNAAASSITRINRFGEPYTPSGRQYMMEINNSLLQAGQTSSSAPPIATEPPLPPVPTDFTATADSGALATMTTIWTSPTTASLIMIIEATPPQSGTKTNVNTLYRQIATLPGNTATPANILGSYGAVFGFSAQVGDMVFLRFSVLDSTTGYRSAAVLFSGEIAAV